MGRAALPADDQPARKTPAKQRKGIEKAREVLMRQQIADVITNRLSTWPPVAGAPAGTPGRVPRTFLEEPLRSRSTGRQPP